MFYLRIFTPEVSDFSEGAPSFCAAQNSPCFTYEKSGVPPRYPTHNMREQQFAGGLRTV